MMTRLMMIACALFMLALPVQARDYSDGFGEETVESFNKGAESRNKTIFKSEAQRAEFADFAAIVGLFRLGVMTDDQELQATLSTSEKKILSGLYQNGDKLERDLWKHFFEGSTIYIGHGLAGTKRVGYHNAFVDGWVLTNWTKQGNSYHLTGLTTRT